MSDLKVVILCNNPIALPSIKEFLFFNKVAAIATPKRNTEMVGVLTQLLQETTVPLLQLTSKNFEATLKEVIEEKKPDAVLMLTFPFIIPVSLLHLPSKGFINFHFGLLPQCAGPHPILWHLINNDQFAGVTVHKVNQGIDTGDIIMQEKILVETNDTYGLLQNKLAFIAAKQAASLLKILSFGSTIPGQKQDASKYKYFKMPTAKNLTINWKTMPAAAILKIVNACNPWNKGAGTQCNQCFFGITEVEIIENDVQAEQINGQIIQLNKAAGLLVKTADNKMVKINIVYTTEGFFSGYKLAEFGIKEGDILN